MRGVQPKTRRLATEVRPQADALHGRVERSVPIGGSRQRVLPGKSINRKEIIV